MLPLKTAWDCFILNETVSEWYNLTQNCLRLMYCVWKLFEIDVTWLKTVWDRLNLTNFLVFAKSRHGNYKRHARRLRKCCCVLKRVRKPRNIWIMRSFGRAIPTWTELIFPAVTLISKQIHSGPELTFRTLWSYGTWLSGPLQWREVTFIPSAVTGRKLQTLQSDRT